MNNQNQTSYRQYLTNRIEELLAASQRNRDLEAKNEHPELNLGYNCMASGLLDTAHEMKNTLLQFDSYCDPSATELTARLALMQNHGLSLQNILLSTKNGMPAVMEAVRNETVKLTEATMELKSKCVTVDPSARSSAVNEAFAPVLDSIFNPAPNPAL